MKLVDYLKIPYRIEIEALDMSDPGPAICRLNCPELPDCSVESSTIEQAMDEIEVVRIQRIVGMLAAGVSPDVPRHSLKIANPIAAIRGTKLEEQIRLLLDHDETEMRRIDITALKSGEE